MTTFQETEQNKLIQDLHTQQEEHLTQQIAYEIGVPYVDLTSMTINNDALRLIPEPEARKAELAVYAMIAKKIDIAVKSPINPETLEQVNRLEGQGYETTLHMASLRSLEKAWSRYGDLSQSEAGRGGLLDISDENLQHIAEQIHHNGDVRERLEKIVAVRDTRQVSQIMETIFGSAIALKSSDVHMEPEETFTRIRFREDGVLQEIITIDPGVYQRILNRIKFISGMKITDTTTAQDGRFTIVYKGMDVEVRVAVAPGAYNQSIVLRILNPEGLAVDFEKLGIQDKLFKVLEREVSKPNGMILTTGPTGSGKTTTLYSFLKKVYDPGIKIITIEDPIEYHLPGITQEQVDHEKGFDFLAGLRAALRQDPDIVMVGEIRDKETATIAVNASLTGHMVFSTLHTNSAAGTIPRLLDLGIQPGILSAALTVSIAQRLIRRLCPHCKKKVPLDPEKKDILQKILQNAERIGKDLASYHVSSSMDLTAYEPVGCDQCNQLGYKGRLGLYEAILTDDIIAKVMAQTPTPTEREIKRAAEHQKILTMIEDGVVKILNGETSYDEVSEVVDLTEDIQDLLINSQDRPLSSPETPVVTIEEVHSSQPATGVLENLSPQVTQPVEEKIPSINPLPLSSSAPVGIPPVMAGEEIVLLVDYLKILEEHQRMHPTVGIAHKIVRAQHMILALLENNPRLEDILVTASPQQQVYDQIEQLMQELKSLEQEQMQQPEIGIADKIATIRNTIQNMRGEVVNS